MNNVAQRPLKVFLCHASADKPAVRKLYRYLKQHGVQPWLDEINLLPGQDWQVEIPRALYSSDIIVVCLSKNSIDKEGYVQKEISFALDKALEKPENVIFIIPARLEDCSIPTRIGRFQWVDLFREGGHKRLMQSLNLRAVSLGPSIAQASITEDSQPSKPIPLSQADERAKEKLVPNPSPEYLAPASPPSKIELLNEQPEKERALPSTDEKQNHPSQASRSILQGMQDKRKLTITKNTLMLGIAGLVIVIGLTLIFRSLSQYIIAETSTPTITFTSTSISTPTFTPTITETPTVTLTSTPSGPIDYTIQEGDSLESIAQKFNLGDNGILLIYYANRHLMEENGGVIFVGQTIKVPPPGSVLPTTTPIPPDLPRGTKVEYQVLPGDTLAGIALKFNSKQEDILTANPDLGGDANALSVGQRLRIPVNLVTATATLPGTSTPIKPTLVGGQPTSATMIITSEIANCTFEENPQFVTELGQRINAERAKTGLPALVIHAQLTAAAKAHATDMLCNNYLSHVALDGSTPQDRVKRAGFNASLVLEELYALHPAYGGNPESALNWWMSNSSSKTDFLNPNITVFGIAYVTSDTSLQGGYFVVILAKP